MAILKFGAIIVQGSGKINSHSIFKTRYGHVMKANGIRSKKSGINQIAQKSKVAYLSNFWSNLSTIQRQKWQEQIENYPYIDNFGDVHILSAFFLFLKINQNWLLFNSNVLLQPNALDNAINLTDLSVVASISSIVITSLEAKSTNYYKIFATRVLSNGISKPIKYLRQIAVVTGLELNNSIDIIAFYNSRFAGIQDNQSFFISSKSISGVSGFSNNVFSTPIPVTVGTATVNEFAFQDNNNYIFQDNNTYIFN